MPPAIVYAVDRRAREDRGLRIHGAAGDHVEREAERHELRRDPAYIGRGDA